MILFKCYMKQLAVIIANIEGSVEHAGTDPGFLERGVHMNKGVGEGG